MPKQAALSAENQETWTQPTKRPAKWVADGQSFPDTDEDDVEDLSASLSVTTTAHSVAVSY